MEDLIRVRAAIDAPIIVRIHRFGDATRSEIEQALAAGADEILLPMVTTVQEVERALGIGARSGRPGNSD